MHNNLAKDADANSSDTNWPETNMFIATIINNNASMVIIIEFNND